MKHPWSFLALFVVGSVPFVVFYVLFHLSARILAVSIYAWPKGSASSAFPPAGLYLSETPFSWTFLQIALYASCLLGYLALLFRFGRLRFSFVDLRNSFLFGIFAIVLRVTQLLLSQVHGHLLDGSSWMAHSLPRSLFLFILGTTLMSKWVLDTLPWYQYILHGIALPKFLKQIQMITEDERTVPVPGSPVSHGHLEEGKLRPGSLYLASGAMNHHFDLSEGLHSYSSESVKGFDLLSLPDSEENDDFDPDHHFTIFDPSLRGFSTSYPCP